MNIYSHKSFLNRLLYQSSVPDTSVYWSEIDVQIDFMYVAMPVFIGLVLNWETSWLRRKCLAMLGRDNVMDGLKNLIIKCSSTGEGIRTLVCKKKLTQKCAWSIVRAQRASWLWRIFRGRGHSDLIVTGWSCIHRAGNDRGACLRTRDPKEKDQEHGVGVKYSQVVWHF